MQASTKGETDEKEIERSGQKKGESAREHTQIKLKGNEREREGRQKQRQIVEDETSLGQTRTSASTQGTSLTY
ncbi:hypothetical protein RRG08_050506 [Elysia crispata]|uniref:Uncharacterized protein n=1 Tax=Elysia crispata TaxID=231223 RepID=A0AAE1CLJ7_9GAST|nr:hypothetical protein RRG08_050506 [Elysia crispata]